MRAPFACDFMGKYQQDGVIVVTPGVNDAKGSYTEIVSAANIPDDVYGIGLLFTAASSSGQARPILADIAADPAGGSNYQVIIPNLNACAAASVTVGAVGFYYYFPLFIKAGSSLAARAQVGNGTAGICPVLTSLYSKPKRPELLRVGSYVDAIGIDLANSRGTALTPGVSSAKGSYASLGALPRSGWWVQGSFSIDDDTMSAQSINLDIAAGSAGDKHILLTNNIFRSTATEDLSQWAQPAAMAFNELPAGAELFARAAVTGAAADSNNTAMAYVLGG